MLRSAASPGSVGFGRRESDVGVASSNRRSRPATLRRIRRALALAPLRVTSRSRTKIGAGGRGCPPRLNVWLRSLNIRRNCHEFRKRGATDGEAMTAHQTMDAKPRPRLGAVLRATAEFAAIIALVVVSRTVVAQPFYVTSGSMEPTLQIGDELLASKFAYGYSRYSLPFGIGPSSSDRLFGKLPDYGDVVLFHLPRDPSVVYVKRAVGLPGDRVQMRHGQLWLNGSILALRADGSGDVEDED